MGMKTGAQTGLSKWQRGVFLACRGLLPLMGVGGSIINIGSISGNQADPSMALYNTSKAFVSGQTLIVDGGLTSASPLQPGLF